MRRTSNQYREGVFKACLLDIMSHSDPAVVKVFMLLFQINLVRIRFFHSMNELMVWVGTEHDTDTQHAHDGATSCQLRQMRPY